MDFVAEFKRRAKVIDNTPAVVEAVVTEPAVAAIVPIKQDEPSEPLFNVHKRSLPVQNPPLDKVVLFNVTKTEFEALKTNREDKYFLKDLKGQCQTRVDERSESLIYYDLVPVNATAAERSIYYNPQEIIKSEYIDEKVEITGITEWIG